MQEKMSYNLADVFELAVDTYPKREYLVADHKRCTFEEMEARANRLAHHLQSQGVQPGDHVGIYAYNCMEWVETLWAVFKIRAVWININFRYVEDELAYIFANADLTALVVAREFLPRVVNVIDSLPALHHTVVIEDHSNAISDGIYIADYETAM